MARRTKEESEKTRAQLLDAAEKLFLQKGVAATSLEDIAQEIGMTRGAIYWHFENKCALFDAMHARVALPLDASFDRVAEAADPLAALKEHCIYMLQTLHRDQRMQNIFTILKFKCEQTEDLKSNVTRQECKRQDVIEKFQSTFERAQKLKSLPSSMDANASAIALYSYISGIFTDYLRNPKSYKLEKLAPNFIELFFKGLQ